jgi:hypothetical protein
MPQIIVLFNLREEADRDAYEAWARSTDLPIVRRLESVDAFDALRAQSLLGGGTPPYQYVEVIRVNDMERFGAEVATETMRKVAAEFRQFADNPQFILCEALG